MLDILLATYNGAAYIADQIESIQRQTYTNWQLIIHDDGSTDETVAICQDYAQNDNRITLINDNNRHLGVAKNFILLLNESYSQYVMFADQDDIWLENKIEIMLTAIEQKNNLIPQAIFSNAYLWSEEQGIISNKNTLTYPTTLEQLLFLNSGVQGAAAIFNAPMRDLLTIPLAHYAMHDHVLVLAAICLGQVDYIDQPLMYYRQHAKNVTGNAPGSIRRKLQLAWKYRHIPIVNADHYYGLKAFYDIHKSEISAHNRMLIDVFLSLPYQNSYKRYRLVCKHQFQLFNSTFLLLAKMSVRRFSNLKFNDPIVERR